MSPDFVLFELLYSLLLTGQYNSQANRLGDTPRRWMIPIYGSYQGSLTDITGMAAAFDRTNANQDCMAALLGGTAGQYDGKQVELAYLGVMERSFRLRHQSAVRSLAHVAGRQRAHGNTYGIFAQVENYAQQLLSNS